MFGELITQYGLTGLFISCIIGSTIFVPFSIESVLLVLVKSGINPYLIVIVASMGALAGTCINYLLGYLGSKAIKKKVSGDKMDHAKKTMDKYGWPGLFVIIFLPIPLPIPVDPVTILPGIARMNFIEFVVVVFLAKLARYSFFVGMFNGLLKLAGF